MERISVKKIAQNLVFSSSLFLPGNQVFENPLKIKSHDFNVSCKKTGEKWEGVASYYSVRGCLGCSNPPIMKNGELLNDSIPTIAAMPDIPLNSFVRVINKANSKSIVAKVTDRGNFHKAPWHRIADLGLKVKNAIGGGDLTEVMLKALRCKPNHSK